MKTIIELEKEIEKEQAKRPIRCFAEAMKYGGARDTEKCKFLKAKLEQSKQIYEMIEGLQGDYKSEVVKKILSKIRGK